MALGDNFGEMGSSMLRAAMPSTDNERQRQQQAAFHQAQLAQQQSLAQAEMQMRAMQFQQQQAAIQQREMIERRDAAKKDIYGASTPDGMRLALEMNRDWLRPEEYQAGLNAHKQFTTDWTSKHINAAKTSLLEKGADVQDEQPMKNVPFPTDIWRGPQTAPDSMLNRLPANLPVSVTDSGWTPLTVGDQTIYAQPKPQRNYGIENGYLLDKNTGEVRPLPPSLGNDSTTHSVNFGNDITIVTKSGEIRTVPYNAKPYITHDEYGRPIRIITGGNGQSYMAPVEPAPQQTNNDPLGLR